MDKSQTTPGRLFKTPTTKKRGAAGSSLNSPPSKQRKTVNASLSEGEDNEQNVSRELIARKLYRCLLVRKRLKVLLLKQYHLQKGDGLDTDAVSKDAHTYVQKNAPAVHEAESDMKSFLVKKAGNQLPSPVLSPTPMSPTPTTMPPPKVVEVAAKLVDRPLSGGVRSTSLSLKRSASAVDVRVREKTDRTEDVLKIEVPSVPRVKAPPVKVDQPSPGPSCMNLVNIATPDGNIEKAAKQEASVLARVAELRRQGLWSEKRLPKCAEPPRARCHWDYLLEEARWMYIDFEQERKFKKNACRKLGFVITRHRREHEEKKRRAEEAKIKEQKRTASFIAREVKKWWLGVEKVVEFRTKRVLEAKKRKALDEHLNFIVDQTEKFTEAVKESLVKPSPTPASTPSQSRPPSRSSVVKEGDIGSEFSCSSEESDDEETLDQEEMDVDDHQVDDEVAKLQLEMNMDVDDVLDTLPEEYRRYLMNNMDSQGKGSRDTSVSNSPTPSSSRTSVTSSRASSLSRSKGPTQTSEQPSTSQVNEDTLGVATSANLLDNVNLQKLNSENSDERQDQLTFIAEEAQKYQPKGYTLETTKVVTEVPFLLRHKLREYQHVGLDWLVTLHDKKLNGILADEMGLGKTMQTIALLAHLACDKENWGPHLIVVPTSVILNWEMEIKKWCPAFKILTYFGSLKDRKEKRRGWLKENAFHVCITSYKLVVQDHRAFKSRRWQYLILDEAHNIKNFKSQRWQMLLNFNCQHRLLLTGTPLQNNLMELWSLMHFLMPQLFASHRDFKDWFSNPLTGMIEGSTEYNEKIVARLHKVLRPFLLRRLKTQVEKQMPKKIEEIVPCALSKRQRFLYDEFMRRGTTKSLLSSGNMMSVLNVLMQLRKVCNHPNLFEPRPIVTPLALHPIRVPLPAQIFDLAEKDEIMGPNLPNFLAMEMEGEARGSAQYRMKNNSEKRLEADLERDDAAPIPELTGFKYSRKLAPGVVNDIEPAKTSAPLFQINQDVCAGINFNGPILLETSEGKLPFRIRAPPNLLARAGICTSTFSAAATSKPPMIITLASTANTTVPMAMPISFVNGNCSTVGESVRTVNSVSAPYSSVYMAPPPPARVPPYPCMPITTTTQCGAVIRARTRFHHPTTLAHQSTQQQPRHFAPYSPAMTVPVTYTLPSGASFVPTRPMISVRPVAKTEPSPSYIRVQPDMQGTISQTPPMAGAGETPAKKVKLNSEPTHLKKLKPVNRVKKEIEDRIGWESKFGARDKFIVPSLVEKEKECAERYRNRLLQLAQCAHFVDRVPVYGEEVIRLLYFLTQDYQFRVRAVTEPSEFLSRWLDDIIPRFMTFVPSVVSEFPSVILGAGRESVYRQRDCDMKLVMQTKLAPLLDPQTHTAMVTTSISFPETRLIEYDCGKLQTLAALLRRLQANKHRCLIFTQMSRVLDILETFLNHHGYIYLRLDGATRIEHRQWLMERFNSDERIYCFILSTRSGGIGVNLTGADTVIFYDSDWNPTMDAQAQDRAHRIGQTRDVTIYRLVSEKTVEENILKKAKQKQRLGELAIEDGGFTSEFFHKSSLRELFEVDVVEDVKQEQQPDLTVALADIEDETDAQAAKRACAEGMADTVEFDEAVNNDVDPEVAKVEADIHNIMQSLRPIERYAVNYLNDLGKEELDQDIKEAEEEIAAKRLEWVDTPKMSAQREEGGENESDDDDLPITYNAEDDPTQMVSVLDPAELWPVWMPPTPPASDQEFDVYTDPVVGFWYEYEPLAEADLPPVFNEVVPMKTPVKVQEKQKHRPSPVKKEAICEVKDRSRSSSIDTVDMCRQASQGSSSLVDLGQTSSSNNSASFAARSLFDGGPSSRYRRDQRRPLTPPALPDDLEQDSYEGPPWTVIEDYAIMQAVTKGQQMAYNFLTANFGHAPNWDFIASRVNFVSDTYRSPRQCSLRFQRTLLPREDGRMVVHDPVTKKPYRVPEEEKSKRVKTGQLWQSEARTVMAQRTGKRFRIVTNKAVQRRHSICKLKFPVSLSRVGRELPEKHARYMHQFAINYSLALSPSAMADIRIERQRERDRQQAEKDRLTREQQVALEEKVRLSQQIQTVTQPPITTPVQSESSPSQSSWSPLTFDLSPISSTPSVLPAWQLPPLGTFANPAIRSQALPAIRPSMVGQHYVTVSQALQGPPAAVLASTQILSPSLAPTVSVSLQQSTGGTPLVNLLPTQGQQLQQVQGVNRYVVGTVAYTLNSQSNQPVQYVVSSTPHTAGRQPSPYTRTTVTRIATPPSTPNSLMGSNLVPVSVAVSSTPQTTQQAIRVSNAQIRPKLAGTVGGSFLIPTDRTTTQIRTQSLARPFQPSIVRRPSSLPKIQTIQSRATTPALTGQPRITRPILSRTPSGTVASSEAAVTESIPSISNIVSPQPRDTHATPTNQTTPQK